MGNNMEHYHVNIPKDFRDYSTENIKVYIYEPLDLSGTIKIVRSKIVILFIWGGVIYNWYSINKSCPDREKKNNRNIILFGLAD